MRRMFLLELIDIQECPEVASLDLVESSTSTQCGECAAVVALGDVTTAACSEAGEHRKSSSGAHCKKSTRNDCMASFTPAAAPLTAFRGSFGSLDDAAALNVENAALATEAAAFKSAASAALKS